MSENAITWIDGAGVDGNPPLLGPMTHAVWMASVVFDGARAFRRLAPDLDRHCARVVQSAQVMGLAPTLDAAEIEAIAWEGIERFPPEAELYIRPVFYSAEGFVVAVPESTRFFLSVFEAPLPPPRGLKVCLRPSRRPSPALAPSSNRWDWVIDRRHLTRRPRSTRRPHRLRQAPATTRAAPRCRSIPNCGC